ncbi:MULTISPECIES: IclR family transcriptional regulator [unclassified Janthinobacterium]|uniref:IclR family transcriptional regulator n=1 Tax=unclassified Janthinobacterium TaxID=2610881 RepID=UPI00161C670D|nr:MULTISPECIES: IclR family transcriptional regulator [unclassified Janthinobacterium]MBB5366802.1 DNA-binding IclR family transcriptional regulator [Janthinobacterium sp. K2C7]MBB5380720.1 DNA-binding IclR family transcriptional regulator [Janthinobacterium sp. K2Li3]MBB5385184.1 DNA-binding IclR family transcriptional regulator [Janthinobacterium sp. K2E3]
MNAKTSHHQPAADPDLIVFSDDEEGKDRQFVNALARGLEVLRCFRPGEVFLSNAEMAKRTAIPKPTISRLSYTLTKLGYLSYSEHQGKYQLGAGVLALGYRMLSNLDVRKMARPLMEELAEHAQASVALGTRDRLSMVYVETCRSSANVTLRLDVGSRIPLMTTAMGKALLCILPQSERDYLMDHARLHDTERWPRIKAGIEQGYKDYQDRGFCISAGEWQTDVHAVGVPMRDADGGPVMAFNCGGPAFLLSRDKLENDLGPRLVALVKTVETNLGRG